jgi:hypothetical protein
MGKPGALWAHNYVYEIITNSTGLIEIVIECVGMKRAHVSIFPKWRFCGIPFFKCRPMN